MTNNKVQIKLKQRCNKLDSNDYDNLECWQIEEAMNKAQVEWCRRQLHGGNLYKEGAEQTIRSIDDLQNLLKPYDLKGKSLDNYFESVGLPLDYFEFNKIVLKGSKDNCSKQPIKVFLTEEANVEILLSDTNYQPSFEWRETFCTLLSNKVRIYTNKEFKIDEATLMYYRLPKEIKLKDCISLDTGQEHLTEQICEFKDDIVELIIDIAASIITGDLESMQTTRLAQNAEQNK